MENYWESDIGTKKPVDTWDSCTTEIRCLFKGQVVKRPALSGGHVHFHEGPVRVEFSFFNNA